MKKLLIISNKTDDIGSIHKACKRLGFTFETIGTKDISATNFESFDIVMLTGGEWFDDPTVQNQNYANELNFIVKSGMPIIGICLGMQLIATAFGGHTKKIDREHHGRRVITLTEEGKKIMTDEKELTVLENHTVGVIDVPNSFYVLSQSEECIEMIKHKNLPIVGVQFHPEKLNKQEHSDAIWGMILQIVNVSPGKD